MNSRKPRSNVAISKVVDSSNDVLNSAIYISPDAEPMLIYSNTKSIIAGLKIENIESIDRNLIITGWSFGHIRLNPTSEGQLLTNTFLKIDRLDVQRLNSRLVPVNSGFQISVPLIESTKYELEWGFLKEGKENLISLNLKVDWRKLTHRTRNTNASRKSIVRLDLKRLKIINDQLNKNSECVLIVGSAPTIKDYEKIIRSFSGEIWALNDAWFWLEKNGIEVDKAFITDSRFITKSITEIEKSYCQKIIVIDSVDLEPISHIDKNVYIFKSLGRDGFSHSYGEVFHGCSVFFTAIQTAFVMKFSEILVCGVLLSHPRKYARIDGTNNMPEYVHSIQIINARRGFRTLAQFDVAITVIEPESNLNFL